VSNRLRGGANGVEAGVAVTAMASSRGAVARRIVKMMTVTRMARNPTMMETTVTATAELFVL
jgi:hypothetical protein